ncbi:DUF2508 family protein [Clostridium sp. cel8]|jgi:hypothetical protein|uniref:DUF2508 family protein n=1 Tax=unclassified Clostridium TaxID=2614128 RepID=UPI0015F3D048|nr:DUF2508 family protein [Clostridium sp. cel8]MBA5851809.1 DUF2508 family protein [Clostridium sp. cel8]
MNKRNIIKLLFGKKLKYTKSQMKLLNDIEKAREEINKCNAYFDSVKDPYLVDYAIYMEKAAKAKYMYLLSQAKKNGIKASTENIIEGFYPIKKSS